MLDHADMASPDDDLQNDFPAGNVVCEHQDSADSGEPFTNFRMTSASKKLTLPALQSFSQSTSILLTFHIKTPHSSPQILSQMTSIFLT